jgi:hypothetical protein
LASLSDGGAFVTGLPNLCWDDEATLRFTDPRSGQDVVARAIVTRVAFGTRTGSTPGVGLRFLEPLRRAHAAADRRSSGRHDTEIRAELEISGRRHRAVILDLAIEGACVRSRIRLAQGHIARLRFLHPVTRTQVTARVHAAWRAIPIGGRPGRYRQGFRMIDSLPALARDPDLGSVDLPRSNVVMPASKRTVDSVRTAELVMHQLLRGVIYRDADGVVRRGRLVLASKKTALIAGSRPPKVGEAVTMAVEAPPSAQVPPLKFRARVVRSGVRLVAGTEPGCVVALSVFANPEAQRRWTALTSWLVQRTR